LEIQNEDFQEQHDEILLVDDPEEILSLEHDHMVDLKIYFLSFEEEDLVDKK